MKPVQKAVARMKERPGKRTKKKTSTHRTIADVMGTTPRYHLLKYRNACRSDRLPVGRAGGAPAGPYPDGSTIARNQTLT